MAELPLTKPRRLLNEGNNDGHSSEVTVASKSVNAAITMCDQLVLGPTNKKKAITIVLLGVSGVGKSTFINALVNYLTYESLDAAKDGQPICLIPVNFTITDPKTWESKVVTLGDQDFNENTDDSTKSATQYPKCYNFEDDKIVLNIIDTPGIADTDGVDKDNRNMQNILDFISNYSEINAFCILLKPNVTRVDVVFKYCLLQLFTHLNKSAANNILFLFTNSRSTHYMPGESGPALMSVLKQIKEMPPNVDIPYNSKTTYCFDSESFRYLVASVPPNDVQFEPSFKPLYAKSWDRSVSECKRLFNYITQLTPHKVMDTLSVNNAKQIIQLLTKPLADITKNIIDNLNECETHRHEIKVFSGSLEELNNKLYIPSVEIISVPLDRPKTVCGADECCERIDNNGATTEINYTSKCHSPCYLEFSDGNVVGNKGLLKCKAFTRHSSADRDPAHNSDHGQSWLSRALAAPTGIVRDRLNQSYSCLKCGHSYEKHLHLFYDTRVTMTKVADEGVGRRIQSVLMAAEIQERQILRLDARIAELLAENETIVNSMAMFACFLANNSLSPLNDAFEDYVRHLIEKERYKTLGTGSEGAIDRLRDVLRQYNADKQLILEGMRSASGGRIITIEMINDCVEKLCKLTHNGSIIRTMLNQQQISKVKHNTEHSQVDYNTISTTAYNMAKWFWDQGTGILFN